MNNRILIVGGYGAVGRHISATLAETHPNRVIVAGRDFEKAKDFSLSLNSGVIPLQFDIFSVQDGDTLLNGIFLVIMCIDQKNSNFVKQCIYKGIHYIDISATYDFLASIELLNENAVQHNSTVMLSIGTVPGISNLLASHCKNLYPEIRDVEIFVLLGLGEAHGEAAIRWSLDQLDSQFFIQKNGSLMQAQSFEDGKSTLFPGSMIQRMTYRFNFSDQHVITKTLNLESASTRICFDSKAMTYLYTLLKKFGFGRLLKRKHVQNLVIRLLRSFRFGSNQVAVKVEARIHPNEEPVYACSIHGNEEARITGLVAAMVADRVMESKLPHGVFHIEQCIDPLELIEELKGHGVFFDECIFN